MTPREIAALIPWSRVFEEVGTDLGRNGRTRCLVHNGDNPNAFVYNDTTGKAHCFSCSWHGDELDFLQKVLGVDFKTALALLARIAGVQLDRYHKPDLVDLQCARAHRAALNAARESYQTWQKQKFNELVAFKFEELLPAIEAAEIAYRALHRKPNLYTVDE